MCGRYTFSETVPCEELEKIIASVQRSKPAFLQKSAEINPGDTASCPGGFAIPGKRALLSMPGQKQPPASRSFPLHSTAAAVLSLLRDFMNGAGKNKNTCILFPALPYIWEACIPSMKTAPAS